MFKRKFIFPIKNFIGKVKNIDQLKMKERVCGTFLQFWHEFWG